MSMNSNDVRRGDSDTIEQTETARALPSPHTPQAPGETLARDTKSLSEFYDGNLSDGAEALVFDGNRRFKLDRGAKDGVLAFSGNGAWVEIVPPAPPAPPQAPPTQASHGNGHSAPQAAPPQHGYPQQAASPPFPSPSQQSQSPFPHRADPPYPAPPGAPYAAPQPMPPYPQPPPQSPPGQGFPPPGPAYGQPPPGQVYAQYPHINQQPPPGPYPQQAQPAYPPQPQPQYPAQYGQPYAQPAPQFPQNLPQQLPQQFSQQLSQQPIPQKQPPPALAVTDFRLETSPTTVYTDPSAVWSQLDEQGKELVWHAMAIGMLLEPGMLKQHGIATMAALMRALHDANFRQMMTEQLAQQHAQANAFMAQQAQQRAQG